MLTSINHDFESKDNSTKDKRMEDHIISPRESILHEGEKPLTKLSVLKELLIAMVSTYLFNILERLGLISNVYFMSRSGDSDLVAALGLANTWIMLIGVGIITNFSAGMSTLVAQAYGANLPKLCSAYFHKGLVINLSLYCCYLLSLAFFKPMLRALGYDQKLLETTNSYLIYMLPSVFGTGLFGTLKFYAQGHKIFKAPVYIQIGFTLIECILSYFIIIKLDFGFPGLSLSRGFSELGRALALFVYMKKSKVFEDTLSWFDSSSMNGFWPQLKFQANSGMVLYVDMLSFLTGQMILAGYDVDEYAASYSAMAVLTFFFSATHALIQPVMSYLGNAVGEGSAIKTGVYWDVSNKVSLVVSITLSLIVVIFSPSLSRIYLDNSTTSSLTQKILMLYGTLLVFDVGQMYFSSVARVFGKEQAAFVGMVLFDLVVGLSLASIMGLYFNFGALGVWVGMMTGIVLNAITQYKIVSSVNIRMYLKETQQRLKREDAGKQQERLIEMQDF